LPGIFYIGCCYFCMKFIRYCFLFWLPYYLTTLNYTETEAGYLSTFFEIGGILGNLFFGWLSDRFPGRRLIVITPSLLLLGGAIGLFLVFSKINTGTAIFSMALIGFFLFGPDSVLSGAVVQDLGGKDLVGRTAGVVNGMGSLGSTFQGIIVPLIATQGWNYVLYLLVATAGVGFLTLIPPTVMVWRNRHKIILS